MSINNYKMKLLVIYAVFSPLFNDVTCGITPEASLVTSSNSVHEGFTKTLSLQCCYNNSQTSGYSLVNSVILSKTSTSDGEMGRTDSDNEICSVTSISPDSVHVKDSLGAGVTGHLDQIGTSCINYKWTYPSSQTAGVYLCQVFGMDNLGHPLVTSASATVSNKAVDLEMILEKMRQMEVTENNLLHRLNDTTSELNGVKVQLNQTKSQLDSIKLQQNQTKSELSKANEDIEKMKLRLNNSRSAITEASASFNGHEYLVSKPTWRNVDVMNLQCELLGGYLIEIDDQQEYDFVASFLTSSNTRHYVIIGNTDRDDEGTWIYVHSRAKATFFKWRSGEPNNHYPENCAELENHGSWLMNDVICNQNVTSQFICEIPFLL